MRPTGTTTVWRKNIPADFDGRHGRDWDDEVDAGIVYKSAVASWSSRWRWPSSSAGC